VQTRPIEWVQLAVPALLYTIQNTMLYVGFANIEAAIGQVTYQSKILWTALFSVVLLRKKLNLNQWLALVVLALGILAVQAVPSTPAPAPAAKPHHRGRAHKVEDEVAAQNPLLGIGALVLAAVCTSFASVYFEKMLKGASNPSLWLRNIQLALYSSVIACAGLLVASEPAVAAKGWMSGFGPLTWLTLSVQALGGILVAVTIKHADNILRGFAQGLALVIGAFGSYFLFDFHLSLTFLLGVLLVIAAIFLYGAKPTSPQELCECLGGLPAQAPDAKVSLMARDDDAADAEELPDLEEAGGADPSDPAPPQLPERQ